MSMRTDGCRHYQLAGVTIEVRSDLPIAENTFLPKFRLFEVDPPGEDVVAIHHDFSLACGFSQGFGEEVYRRPPWAIYRKENSWIYLEVPPDGDTSKAQKAGIVRYDHSLATVYHSGAGREIYLGGNLHSLTLFPTDQVLLARVLADRRGCYLHAAGVILHGKGLLFVGHSGAGKSTITTLLKDRTEVLCDDRMIARAWPEGFRIHGTWSHGDIPDVSPNSAPLKALLFLEQSSENRLVPLEKKSLIFQKLLACLIRPLVTEDWWDKVLPLVEKIASEVPCYSLQFDRSGEVVDVLEELVRTDASRSNFIHPWQNH